MKNKEELVVITKTYDLILWSCNHTGRFPRQHRFVLGERLERKRYVRARFPLILSVARFVPKTRQTKWFLKPPAIDPFTGRVLRLSITDSIYPADGPRGFE